MFGNLFNQKKEDGTPVDPNQPVAQPVNSPFPADQTAVVAPPAVDVSGGTTMDPSKRQNVAALSRLDPRATQVLQHATSETKRIQQALIEPDQLLFGLLYDGDIFKLIEEFGADAAAISKEIQTKEQSGTFSGQPTMSDATKQIFEEAYGSSKNRGASFISPEDILIALFSAPAGSALQSKGVDKEKVSEKLSKNGEFATGKKSVLDKFGIDLTAEAKAGKLDPLTGREKELERLIHILLRRSKNNPIIIGEAGTGKTAIVEALAQKIANGDVPKELQGKRIIQLELSSLVAGASHRGEFEERLRNLIKEVQLSEGQIILFIDEIHTVIGAGDSGGALDASNIIKPYLARGQLQLIGTTTTSEYRKYFEKDKAFQRRFQPIMVPEPDDETALKMMDIVRPRYEKFHNVVITPEALDAAVKLSRKYIGERYLPDKGVDLIDEAAAEVKLALAAGTRQDNQVKRADIEKVVSAWTGVPITKLTEDESQKLLNLEKMIHERFIDQEQAVAAVAEAVRRGRIGLSAANRPIASFVFLGPTGVGKTELAKALADLMFGREDAMIRLDMSEYMEKHEVAKLIGAPPGYVGYEEGGQLTEAVRAKPYSIVLFDEVEKAHPDVYNILLQLLEDGRLTDNKGNTISFKNTIVICTSNIGSQLIQKFLMDKQALEQNPSRGSGPNGKPPVNGGVTPDQLAQQAAGVSQVAANAPANLQMANKTQDELSKLLMDELHKFFKPELLNRFDDLVMFKPLEKKDMMQIAKLGIQKTEKLLKEQGYAVTISDAALAQLAEEGYDPVYGARPLRRLIQSSIENPIALLIINKTFASGDTILIDYDKTKQQFTFTKAMTQQQPGQTPAGQTPSGDTVGTSPPPGQSPSGRSLGGASVPGQVPPPPGAPQPMPDPNQMPPTPQVGISQPMPTIDPQMAGSTSAAQPPVAPPAQESPNPMIIDMPPVPAGQTPSGDSVGTSPPPGQSPSGRSLGGAPQPPANPSPASNGQVMQNGAN